MSPSASLPVRARALAVAVVLPPLLLFAAHALPLGDWIVDDAGISFAYARTLAAGHGFVAQPGAAPVEGFSNPLWTLLLAACFRLGLFHVVWTPKLLGLALVLGTFALVAGDLRRAWPGALWPALLAPLLLAASTAFVVWTASGLENPLWAVLAALSCVLTTRVVAGERRLEPLAGATAALLALTRPDAILYAAALPIALLLSAEARGAGLRSLVGRLLRHAAGFAPLYGGYLLFRRWYYGEWVPNTYYAKEKPSLAFLLDWGKWSELLSAALGPLGLCAGALLAGAALFALARGAVGARGVSLGVHLALAASGYMLMPLDWMGEYRFATTFFLFFYWALAEMLAGLWARGTRAPRVAAAGLALAAVAASVFVHVPRSADFASGPIVPFAEVAAFDGHGFNRLAEELPPGELSLLTPDVGGTLYYSRLKVYDLVGLCDRTAARTLTTDTAAFHRYVFEQLRPTFIHVHRSWAGWAAFHTSERFQAEYVPVREVWPREGERSEPGEPVWGDYVRKDALGPDPEAVLERLRQAYVAAGMVRADL